MGKIWLSPLAMIYGAVLTVRHKLFDWGLLRSTEYDIPVICIGNLTVGGTGKTPVTEFLIENLKATRTIAVLSRGYKRRTKGYLEIETKTSFRDSGDEARQIKRKYPDILVVVCEDRRAGISEIRKRHPQVDLILLDDGFQHRYVEPWINIVLVDYTRPVYRDHLLPWGTLRDKVSQLHRAHYVIVTKCPPEMNPLERRLVRKSLGLYPYQTLFFTEMDYGRPLPLFPEENGTPPGKGTPVIAMSGIGNPGYFIDSLSENFDVTGTLTYGDHHLYRRRDLKDMEGAIEASGEDTVLITTEKDAVKLAGSSKIPAEIKKRLFYIPIRLKFNGDSQTDFLQKLYGDVRTNPKHSLLHP